MKVRKHIFFSGQVQGVGFRYRAIHLARPLGLTRWARNLRDGRVEMEVQGDALAIEKLLAQLTSQRFIEIEGIQTESVPLKAREPSFFIADD